MGLSGDSPRYSEWTLVRRIEVAGFAADDDWIADQPSVVPGAFQVPPLPGRPGNGFAVMAVGVDANGAPVAPGAGTIDLDIIELVRFSGDYDDKAPHACAVEDLPGSLTPLAITLPANIVTRLPGVGGSQNQFALRATALSAPAGAAEVRLLIKPLGV